MIFGLVVAGGPVVENASLSYKGHRYPVEVIAHCVWLYFR
ncbi:IS6 family transposase, partial [Streptomyces sp. NPDC058394]